MKTTQAKLDKVARLDTANAMIECIASVGRRFFAHKAVSRLSLDAQGRVWLCDGYSGKMVYTHYTYQWRGFSEGGTLRQVIIALRDFVCHATPLAPRTFGPWPNWYSEGDPWGYGAEAQTVRDRAAELGLIKVAPVAETVGA